MSAENPFKSYAGHKDAESNNEETRDERPTLSDILAREAGQFGKMLQSYEDPAIEELGQRLVKRTLTAEDLSELAELRKEYLKRKEAAEYLNDSMTDEHIDELARYSPQFEELRTLVGPDALRTIIRSGITEKAMSDPDSFQNIAQRQARLVEVESKAEVINANIRTICEKYKLSSTDAVVKAMAIKDRAERETALREALRSEMGVFKKLFERKSEKQATSLAHATEDIDYLLKRRTQIMEGAGQLIAQLVSEDKEMRDSLTRAIYKEQIIEQKPEKVSLKDISNQVPTEEGIQAAWNAYKQENGFEDEAKWNALPDPERDAERKKFEEAYRKKNLPPQQSFWNSILRLCCVDMFGDNLK